MTRRSGGFSRPVIVGYTLFFGLLPFGHRDGGGATYLGVRTGKFVKAELERGSNAYCLHMTMVVVIMAFMTMI